jgi:hypothetical protein
VITQGESLDDMEQFEVFGKEFINEIDHIIFLDAITAPSSFDYGITCFNIVLLVVAFFFKQESRHCLCEMRRFAVAKKCSKNVSAYFD